MDTKTYSLIGVMSGTSKDGIDLAAIQLNYTAMQWQYRFLAVATVPYTKAWEVRLTEADTLSASALEVLNKKYTHYLAEKIQGFIDRYRLHSITTICSHGHTVLHQPEKGKTLQIGNLPLLADILQKRVICDFRTQDVQLGGQGAPLVPIGDRLLFPQYTACINLGGFANISFEKKQRRIAYDICPVNTVLNFYAQQCGKPYDYRGRLARSEKINRPLLQRLDELKFYHQNPPKSLGIEWVKAVIFPLIDKAKLSSQTILATFTRHIAQQLAKAIPAHSGEILLTGGGAYNAYLIQSLRDITSAKIIIPDPQLVDYKESLIFGLLGVLRLRGEDNVLGSVTGAPRDHCAGRIYPTL